MSEVREHSSVVKVLQSYTASLAILDLDHSPNEVEQDLLVLEDALSDLKCETREDRIF